MDIQRVIYVLRAIGFNGIVRAIHYGFIRDRIDQQFSRKSAHTEKCLPGVLTKSISIRGGLRLEFEHAQAEVLFLKPELVRISWQPGRSPIPYTIAKTDWDAIQPRIDIGASETIITSDYLVLSIDHNGGISFKDGVGINFRNDNPPFREGEKWTLSTKLFADEHIYGLGERANKLNLRQGRYYSWNTDPGGRYSTGKDPLYIGTPVYLSVSNAGCYLVYFENSHPATFQIGDDFKASFSGGMLRYYIISGTLDHIFSDLAELIGHPFMPPKWALGYHQSRWSYGSEAEIRSVIQGFEEHDLPISAIHLDIDYMDGFRVFTFNHQRFPNPKQLIHELDERGIKVVATINPAVKRDNVYKVYSDGLAQDIYCKLPDGKIFFGTSWPGWSAFPDFTNPGARAWWKEQYNALLEVGISGIWHDMNEPASFAAWGDKSFPTSITHTMDGQGGNHNEAHNIYGLLMDQAGYEALQEHSPTKRPWILSRAGWAGVQRYSWSWTGDVETSWESLEQTIPTILGLGLSGHIFSGVDIGGFSGSPTSELYLRWFQLAAFLPLFRTHSAIGTKSREPWDYGEPITSIIRKFLNLRYQLMPYLYTLSWSASQYGVPIIRPVFWDTPTDISLWDVDDEFLFGDSILVAPIVHHNETQRLVAMPPGRWFSFWDDQIYPGSSNIQAPVNSETIPIFIKAGALIPMVVDGQVILHLYLDPANNSSDQIYFDKGDGYTTWRLDTYQVESDLNTLNLNWIKSGNYPFPYPNIKIKVHGYRATSITADGIDYPIQDNSAILPVFQSMRLHFD